ncbi:hypothetical protein MBANPS3_003757 [Mucor bainieri]
MTNTVLIGFKRLRRLGISMVSCNRSIADQVSFFLPDNVSVLIINKDYEQDFKAALLNAGNDKVVLQWRAYLWTEKRRYPTNSKAEHTISRCSVDFQFNGTAIQDSIDPIELLANKLIHGIVTSNEGRWGLITQIEIYLNKDRNVDDVANVSKADIYHDAPKVAFEKLSEVLVNGEFLGCGTKCHPFLGAAALVGMINGSFLVLYSPEVTVKMPYDRAIRLLTPG